MSEKTNMTHLDFNEFVAANKLEDEDEEEVC